MNTKNILLYFFILIAPLSLTTVQAGLSPHTFHYNETCTVTPPNGMDSWQVVHKYAGRYDGNSIIEAVPKGQTLKKFTDMLTIQFRGFDPRAGGHLTALEYMKVFKNMAKERSPKIVWKVIKKNSSNDVVYEWRIQNSPEIEDQHEIARIIITDKGLHRVAFVKKVPQLSLEERQEWIQALSKATLIN